MTMDIGRFEKLPLLGIIRGISPDDIEPLVETAAGAGLRAIEITMNTPVASGLISRAIDVSGGRIDVGAGTVLSVKDLDEAVKAGASFIVTPSLVTSVADSCVRKKIPFFPGAFTPKEVLEAWQAGPCMVKVFPSGMFGPKYIKELKGPFDRIKMMAVGGVRPENIAEYFSSGADAVAFGASVFKKEWLEAKDFASIGKLIGEYVGEVKRAVKSRF
jgi:2-dehydro-3-deoxyphosphogluconate aldolase/(4S)-4-hydroxy-2-oxoglutarate aldolase